MDVEFLIEAAEVGVNGVVADAEVVGDFFDGFAFDEAFEDLEFARGEAVVGDSGSPGAHHFENLAGDVAVEGGTAVEDVVDAVGDLLGVGGFEEVTGGAGADGFSDFGRIIEGGEHDDLGGGGMGFKFGDAVEAAHAGQTDIEEYDVDGVAGG